MKTTLLLVSMMALSVQFGLSADDGDKKAAPDAKGAIVNSIGMKLAYIAPGKFLMGSPKEEKGGHDEFQHEVEITKGFYMGAYTVTQEEYEKVMGTNPSWHHALAHGKSRVAGLDTRRFPVEHVSWDDAKEFCGKLGAKEGKTYRLPTEAEWEYACRAGTKTAFYFGDTLSTDQANYNGAKEGKGLNRNRAVEVGSFPPNAWGLYDMHANVWQWCEDWAEYGYYNKSPKADPVNTVPAERRVARGGAWDKTAGGCRSAQRFSLNTDNRCGWVGFRVALSTR